MPGLSSSLPGESMSPRDVGSASVSSAGFLLAENSPAPWEAGRAERALSSGTEPPLAVL